MKAGSLQPVSSAVSSPKNTVAYPKKKSSMVRSGNVLKALLPEDNGRDVYPRVQVNGRAVCLARALCVCVWLSAERGGVGET